MDSLFPVRGLAYYKSGVVEVLREGEPVTGTPTKGKRQEITRLTHNARSKMMFRLINSEVKFGSMLTLTCGMEYPVDGRRYKQTLNRFLVAFRRAFPSSYFWFLEFQKRGAPHVHLYSTVRNPTRGHRSKAARLWVRANQLSVRAGRPFSRLSDGKVIDLPFSIYEQHVRPQTWEAFRTQDGSIRYAAKYALKTFQKDVPLRYQSVGRFWGASRDVGYRQADSVIWNIEEDEVRRIASEALGRDLEFEYLPKFLFGAKAD